MDENRTAELAEHRKRARMSVRQRVLFFVVAWAIVLMPFLFWRATWFGASLSNDKVTEYLHDDQKPRNIQYALVQVNERMAKHDPAVKQWYPDLVRLATYPVEEIRNTDAWVMGQDTSQPDFHAALLKMLHDSSALVRGNAALALVRFGDSSGHDEIVTMLRPTPLLAPKAGKVVDEARPGTAVRKGGVVIRIDVNGDTLELRSPLPGRVGQWLANVGDNVQAGQAVGSIRPGEDQAWEAMRALFLIGKREDLDVVNAYTLTSDEVAERVVQQAALTRQAILERSK